MYEVHTMTPGGTRGKSYIVDGTDVWTAMDIAAPLAEDDGYEVLDGQLLADGPTLIVADS